MDKMYSFINKKSIKYLFTYFTIGLSGITFFTQREVIFIFSFLFSVFLFFHYKKKIDKTLLFISLFLISIAVIQSYNLGTFSYESLIGNVIIWLYPYFIIRLIGPIFTKYYIKTLYFLSIISIIFWIGINLSSQFLKFLDNLVFLLGTDPIGGENLLIFNTEHLRPGDFFIRNPGPFNEGGAFSSYLVLALGLNIIHSKSIFNKINVIFIISILSTRSTAGYIAVFIMLMFYYFWNKKLSLKLIIFPIITFVSIYAFFNLDFLFNKIYSQFSQQTSGNKNLYRVGRFGGAIADLEQLRKYPLSGRGFYKEDRFYTEEDRRVMRSASSMGIIAMITRHGLFYGILYFVFLFKFFIYYSRKEKAPNYFSIIGISGVLLTGSAQFPFITPVFISLVYIYLIYYKNLSFPSLKKPINKNVKSYKNIDNNFSF